MRVRLSTDGVSLAGKTALVTGATSGIGLETAIGLARLGAHVIVSGRREAQGRDLVARINTERGTAAASYQALDLAGLANVARFAENFAAQHDRLDILVNNAGVLAIPTRTLTVDGFEMQYGVNYLGHFALTAHLLPLLRRAGAARVVNISSISHHAAGIRLDDPHMERGYAPWKAYAQTKLAMLMFALEFQRRSVAAGWGVTGLAAHPGVTSTELPDAGARIGGPRRTLNQRIVSWGAPIVGQRVATGALPTIVAAAGNVPGGSYIGPAWLFEMRGPPTFARIAPGARNGKVAAELWDISEKMTGVSFAAAGSAH